jgi:hypothetical protein
MNNNIILSITTFSIMTFSIMILSIAIKMQHSAETTQSEITLSIKCRYDECF